MISCLANTLSSFKIWKRAEGRTVFGIGRILLRIKKKISRKYQSKNTKLGINPNFIPKRDEMILPEIGPRKEDLEVEQLSDEQSSSLSRFLEPKNKLQIVTYNVPRISET